MVSLLRGRYQDAIRFSPFSDPSPSSATVGAQGSGEYFFDAHVYPGVCNLE